MNNGLTTRIDLIRHGEPKGGSRYRGFGIDDVLTDRGWAQMYEGIGSQEHWDWVVSSPLLRCAEFSQRIAQERKIELLIEPSFKEIGFGLWEGKTKDQLRATRPKEFHSFYANPVFNTPEGAEPVEEFFTRVTRAWDSLLQKSSGKQVLVVAHAGVIRAVVAHVLGASAASMYKLEIKNGHITRCVYHEGRGVLEGLNLTL